MMKNEKMMKEMEEELAKAGIKKEEIDDYMVWGVMKLMLGIMKIKWSLKESGVKDAEAKKKLNKIVSMISEKDADTLHEMMHKNDGCGCGDWKK